MVRRVQLAWGSDELAVAHQSGKGSTGSQAGSGSRPGLRNRGGWIGASRPFKVTFPDQEGNGPRADEALVMAHRDRVEGGE